MADFYLQKPFRTDRLLNNQKLGEVDLGRSISNHIELIIFTRPGEHRFNPEFGCDIWNLDFELIVSEATWEEKFRKSLLKAIALYEHRIRDVQVTIKINEVEKFFPQRNVTEIKKKVLIHVDATMQDTAERYSFSTSLFLSPLSR